MPAPPQALYFGPAGDECFGWLHRVPAPSTIGVVICSSVGREDFCFHRSLRELAMSAAAQGLPSLRFDYPGTGDSAAHDLEVGRVQAWIDSVSHAIDVLKHETGAAAVCIVGIRLGALLAAFAASRRADVAGLVAVAPVVSGKTFVRELKALGAADGGERPAIDEAGVLEAGGFALAADAQHALSELDLLKPDTAPAPRIFIVPRDDVPPDSRWRAHLQRCGASVESQEIPGYAAMLGNLSPHESVVPASIIDAATRWMTRLRHAVPAPRAMPAGDAMPKRELLLRPRAGAAGPEVREQVYTVKTAGASLVGVLSTAADGIASQRHGILLLPPGGDRRIGSGRLFAHAARKLAAQGHAVLRLDLSGLGDSAARPDERENWPYNPTLPNDVALAVNTMRHELGVSRCIVIGHCSGAYNAMRAAMAGAPVDAVLLVNPLVFLAGSDIDTPPVPRALMEAEHAARAYRGNLANWARWRSVATHPAKAISVARRLAGIARQRMGQRARDLARLSGWRFDNDFPSELLALCDRGTRVHFVFSSRDPGELRLWALGGAALHRLVRQGSVSITRNHRADHVYSRLADRKELLEVLMRLAGDVSMSGDGGAMPSSNGLALSMRRNTA